VHFRNALALRRHVQLSDHLAADRFDFRRHSRSTVAAFGILENDRAYVPACRHPFAIVPAHRTPVGWLFIVDLFREGADERLYGSSADGHRLTPIEFFEILNADLRQRNQVGRVR